MYTNECGLPVMVVRSGGLPRSGGNRVGRCGITAVDLEQHQVGILFGDLPTNTGIGVQSCLLR
jgi:hypothetical protein